MALSHAALMRRGAAEPRTTLQGEATARTLQILCASCRETGGRRPLRRIPAIGSLAPSIRSAVPRFVVPLVAMLNGAFLPMPRLNSAKVFHLGFASFGISIPLGIGCAPQPGIKMSFQYSGSAPAAWMMPRCKGAPPPRRRLGSVGSRHANCAGPSRRLTISVPFEPAAPAPRTLLSSRKASIMFLKASRRSFAIPRASATNVYPS